MVVTSQSDVQPKGDRGVLSPEVLLYGADPTPRIVAVERAGIDAVTLYSRGEDGVITATRDRLRPWLVADRAEPWAALRRAPEIDTLAGDHPFRYLIRFASWPDYVDAERAARDAKEAYVRLRSPIEQYLLMSGRTLFKGMVFEDLRRLQIDIETTGLDSTAPDAEIIGIAVRSSGGQEWYLGRLPGEPEANLLLKLNERIQETDPEVIEGHNIFNFDVPFLIARAERLGVALRWGRDGSPPRLGQGVQRFKVAALTLPFTPCYVHGRHVVDTYQQIQRYDTAGRLGSYALKRVMRELGLERDEREFIAGELIYETWQDAEGRARLEKYALDDVRDVDALARLCLPTEFYQAQLVPRPFQNVAIGGPGEKINDMMLRAYLHAGHSIPKAQQPRDYPGGHAELLRVGDFRPVVKCDVESLYPSIMLAERITSKSDVLNASLPMLADLTNRRLHAKAQSRRTTGNEQAMWDGLQSSFKVLINSFYGYLGYGAGFLNDYDAAERVTLAGQDIIKRVVDRLQDTGSIPIEVDTDGVYFVPPSHVKAEADEVAYVQEMGSTLPPGIRLAHDGSYAGMLSLKLKNYALLDHDGRMILKGSSLRSRRMERCFRDFLSSAAKTFLSGDREVVRDHYFNLGERIRNRALRIDSFIQWGMLTEQTLRAQPRFKRLEVRLAHDTKTGDRIAYYEREDGELALLAEYANDESIPYLLKRLRDVADRFRPLFASDSEFEAFFPQLSTRTDMEAARAQEAAAQLSLFG